MRAVHETSRVRAALDAYLALGPSRSLEKLHQSLANASPSVRWLKAWSASFDWQRRAVAYDAEQLAKERAEREAADALERAEARRARLALAKKARARAEAALDLLKDIQLLKNPADIVALAKYADTTERLDMGEPTDRREIGGTGGGALRVLVQYEDEPSLAAAPVPDADMLSVGTEELEIG